MLRFYVITLFPKVIENYCEYGMVRQAIKKGKVSVKAVDLREFARQVDDEPYGGMPGMVIKPQPVFDAYDYILSKEREKPYTLITEPWGRRIDQSYVEELLSKGCIAVVCGRYEGVDERVKSLVDEEVSIGDFILSGGELVALALIEAVSRLVPGVLSEPKSIEEDSYSGRWLGYPVYTRPREFRGMSVPKVLLSGNHRLIELWKLWHRIENTLRKRPDMVPTDLTPLERDIVKNIKEGKSFDEWVANS